MLSVIWAALLTASDVLLLKTAYLMCAETPCSRALERLAEPMPADYMPAFKDAGLLCDTDRLGCDNIRRVVSSLASELFLSMRMPL